MTEAVEMIDKLPLTRGDTKGDLYEYMLSKLTTAGINGQFRTPRHIINLMVQLVDPRPDEIVADPAAGTGGFLVGVMQYLLEKHTSPEGIIEQEEGGKIYSGDLLEPYRKHINEKMFHGFEFDLTMLRIATMNLLLHNVSHPAILYQDTLSKNFAERYADYRNEHFDVILANPPFKGSLDDEDVAADLTARVKTRKTELLFLVLMMRMLKVGGRCASVVPDGVLFGASKAHVALRKLLLDKNQLEGIVSLPSGVFKPYAGVSTAIVVFTRGGKTDRVWFYDVENDGFSLDDKRIKIEADDLPDILKHWRIRDNQKVNDRKEKAFFVPADEIRENHYDLSLNRYKEVVYEEEVYDPPSKILNDLKSLEKLIQSGLEELEGLLK